MESGVTLSLRRADRIAVATMVALAPAPALAHGEQVLMLAAMFPWLVVSLAFLLWLGSPTGERRARRLTTTAVLGSSAALFVANGTLCLTWWWCSGTAWELLLLAQLTIPTVLWVGLWWRARRKLAGDR